MAHFATWNSEKQEARAQIYCDTSNDNLKATCVSNAKKTSSKNDGAFRWTNRTCQRKMTKVRDWSLLTSSLLTTSLNSLFILCAAIFAIFLYSALPLRKQIKFITGDVWRTLKSQVMVYTPWDQIVTEGLVSFLFLPFTLCNLWWSWAKQNYCHFFHHFSQPYKLWCVVMTWSRNQKLKRSRKV